MVKYKFSSLLDIFKKAMKKGAFLILGANIFNKVLAFISSTLVVHFIAKAEYGVYSYANNQLSFFVLLSGLGVSSGILQVCSEIKNDDEQIHNLYAYGCKVGFWFNLLLAVIIFLYSRVVNLSIDGASILLGYMCLLPLVRLFDGMQTSLFRSRLENKKFVSASVLSGFLSCVCAITGAYFFKVSGVIVGQYFSAILAAFLVFVFFGVSVGPFQKFTLENARKKDLMKISVVSMMNSGISQILYLFDVFIVGLISVSDVTVASYKVATVIPTALTFIPISIVTFVYPYFARNSNNKIWLKQYFKLVFLATLAIDVMVVLALFVTAPWLIEFLYGKEYLDAVSIYRLLLCGFAFSGAFRILSGNLLVTQRELKFNFIVALVGGTINIIADVIFIRLWGSMGAAIATVLVQVVSGMLNTSRLLYIIKKKPNVVGGGN